MRAVYAEDGRGGIDLRNVPVPLPGKGEVLIRMAASPVNPSDLALIDRTFGSSAVYPLPAGREGSGTVVAAGGGLLARRLLGKQVAVAALGGAWADFNVVRAVQCLPLKAGLHLEEGAMALVNPVTAVALLDYARTRGHRAVVNTAAAGQFGRMVHRLFEANGIPVIHIVRREAQAALLAGLGARDVLISTSPDFNAALKEKARARNASLFLDALGGQMTGQLVEAAPAGSTIMLYGMLAGEPASLNQWRLMNERVRVEGFFLGTWFQHTPLLKALRLSSKAMSLIPGTLRSEVAGKFLLPEAAAAVEHARAHATAGKALLVIDPDAVDLRL